MKRIKRMVAKKNVTIAFFIHLHIVMMRDVKNVRKSMNSRKTSVLLKMVRIIQIDLKFFVPVELIKDLGKLATYFK